MLILNLGVGEVEDDAVERSVGGWRVVAFNG